MVRCFVTTRYAKAFEDVYAAINLHVEGTDFR